MYIFTHILVMCILMVFFLVVLSKQSKNDKMSRGLYEALNRNLMILTDVSNKQYVHELKNSIHIYSKFQILQKITNADFISVFKYNYSNKYLSLDFLFSMDSNSSIVQNSILENFPITGDLLAQNVLNSNCHLCSVYVEELHNCEIYDNLKSLSLAKIYYQSIFKEQDTPVTFVAFSYKDREYNISEEDKVEVSRILNNIHDIENIEIESIKEKKIENKRVCYLSRSRKWLHRIIVTGIIMLLSGVMLINYIYINSDQIFLKYFKPYEFSNVRGQSVYNSIETGIYEYNKGEYGKALRGFEENVSDSNEFVLFFSACSALFDDQPDKALHFFDNWDINSPFYESVEWYTAGCYLKKKDFKTAKVYLEKISDDKSHFYSHEASQILKRNL